MCQSDYIITFLFCMMFFLPPLSFKGRAWLTTFKLEEEGDRKINLLFKFLLLTITFWETLITQSHWKNVKNQSSQERGDTKGNKEKSHSLVRTFSFLHLWQRVQDQMLFPCYFFIWLIFLLSSVYFVSGKVPLSVKFHLAPLSTQNLRFESDF